MVGSGAWLLKSRQRLPEFVEQFISGRDLWEDGARVAGNSYRRFFAAGVSGFWCTGRPADMVRNVWLEK
jgi:hypothetical protein